MEEFLYGKKLCVGHSFPLIDSSRLLVFFNLLFSFALSAISMSWGRHATCSITEI